MVTKCNLDARVEFFNLQILHRSLITNNKLKNLDLEEADSCEECGNIETIKHQSYDYLNIRILWDTLTT